MQTILGAGGTIGKPLARELAKTNTAIRLVSRNPVKVNDTDELLAADLTSPEAVENAIAGSKIVYVTIGFEYKTTVWQAMWPRFIKAVVDGCVKHQSKLVFFDNMYMYDHAHLSNMTEETPINPQTKKGQVRATVVKTIWDAVETGKLQAIIARAADFIGGKNSIIGNLVLENQKKGKKAQWLISTQNKHNFTYVNDAARAVAQLGNAADTWNAVWHLPSTPAKTGQEWIALCAEITGKEPKVQVATPFILSVMSLFVPVLKEIKEMSYQWSGDYFFNSQKFEERFGWKATEAKKALEESAQQL
jgi:nucleoside-diphosphate-sugar epimerase